MSDAAPGGDRRPRRAGRRAAAAVAAALACGAGQDALAATSQEMFDAGNAAYLNEQYGEAAATYEEILAYGLHDPRLYFNLGNAYFKLGRLGPAILNYERALRLAPGDRDASENLELARGQIRDRVAAPEMQHPVRVIKGLIDATSANGLSAVFLALYLGAGGLFGWMIVSRGYVRRRLLGYGALAAGLAAAVACGALVYKDQDITAGRAIVMEDRVDVRSGPAGDNTILFTVHEGTRLDLRNHLEGWYQVSLPNALSGWIPEASVERV